MNFFFLSAGTHSLFKPTPVFGRDQAIVEVVAICQGSFFFFFREDAIVSVDCFVQPLNVIIDVVLCKFRTVNRIDCLGYKFQILVPYPPCISRTHAPDALRKKKPLVYE